MAKEHKVRQGECVSSISYDYGFFPDTLWSDSANKKLRDKRKNPNVLLQGDVVIIPDKRTKDISCDTEQTHRFRRKGVPENLKVIIEDEHDEPRRNQPYVLTIDGINFRGSTNEKGYLEQIIPPNAKEGRLIIGEGPEAEEYLLNLGFLDSIDEITGIQQRLINLGFGPLVINGQIDNATIDAIETFQSKNKIDVTGKPDETTKKKLLDIHGS